MWSPLFNNASFIGALSRLHLDRDRIVPCWRGTVKVIVCADGLDIVDIHDLKQKSVNESNKTRLFEMYTWVRDYIVAAPRYTKRTFYYDDGVRLSLKFCVLAALGLRPTISVTVGSVIKDECRIQLSYTIMGTEGGPRD